MWTISCYSSTHSEHLTAQICNNMRHGQTWIWSRIYTTLVSKTAHFCKAVEITTMHKLEIFEKLPRAVFYAYTTPFESGAPCVYSRVKFSVVRNTWNVIWFCRWKIKTQNQTKTFVTWCNSWNVVSHNWQLQKAFLSRCVSFKQQPCVISSWGNSGGQPFFCIWSDTD